MSASDLSILALLTSGAGPFLVVSHPVHAGCLVASLASTHKMPSVIPLFLLAVTHTILDVPKVPWRTVVPGRDPLAWTEGRVVGATELIIAPAPLNPEFEI